MRAPARPDNESDRLSDLYDYGILDTPAERVFDEIAALAATICGTPYAALTLIDGERQWFKAAFGISLGETSRDESICGHAILERELFEVPDTWNDERFTNNRFLAGPPEIRFYGGSQLTSERGNNIGMLCVLDGRPRELTPAQRLALDQLADVVMAVLEASKGSRLQSWLGTLFDRIAEEVFITDPDTLRFLHANATAQHALGYSLQQLRQLTPMDVTADRQRADFEGYVRQLRAGAPHVVFEGTRRRSDGVRYPVEVRWQLLATGGRPVLMSIVQDISERKQVDRMKDEFVSVVNHELRTPLTSIHGAVKLLQQGAGGVMPPAAARLVALAADNTDRLRRIVDDILHLEQIASGKMEFNLEPLDAAAVLDQLAHGYETAAAAVGVTLAVLAAPHLQLTADPQRLHQVMANLVSNAIKFAPRDSRVLLEAAPAAPAGAGRVRLSVTDAGPGIPDHFRERIFQRFAQADMDSRRTKGGSGLGLSIAKQMTEHMGGSIGYESRPGHTCFHVTFPEVSS